MRIHSIRLRGLVPFPYEVSLDLDALQGQLVAVCGGNGAGKSTLMESIAGSFYRKCPTRGSLVSVSRARDAFVESKITNGKAWTIHHDLDGVSGKSEASVLDASGHGVLENRLVRSFDAWGAKTLPPPSVLYASTFAAQGSGGFLSLPPTERKGVLLRVQGVERLEKLAELARGHLRDTKAEIAVAEGRISELKANGADVATARNVVHGAIGKAVNLKVERDAAEFAACAAQQSAKETAAHNAIVEKRRQELATATAAKVSAEQRRNQISSRIMDVRLTLEGADKAREAQARVVAIGQELATVDAELAAIGKALESAKASKSAALGLEEYANRALSSAKQNRDNNLRIVAEKDRLLAIAANLPTLEADVAAAESDLKEASDRLEALRNATVADAGARAAALRAALEKIAADHSGEDEDVPTVIANAAIDTDDEAIEVARQMPHALDAAKRAHHAATIDIVQIVAKRNEARSASDRAAGMHPAEGLDEAVTEAQERLAQAKETSVAAQAEVARLSAENETRAYNRKLLLDERAKLAPEAQRAEALAGAEATLVELETQLAETEREFIGAEMCADALVKVGIPELLPLPDVAPLEAKLRDAERWLAQANAAVGVAEKALETAKANAERIEKLTTERLALLEDAADWTKLANDLGRDGLQAILIDSIAPELTTLTNDLLHECVGPRWTVTIAMNRPGEGSREECIVRVIDTVNGSDVDAEVLSGGEGVIVGEAISLALCCLACRNWGTESPTLIRDESGAALSPEMTRAYAGMLRRAAKFVGAAQTLVVTHSEELAAMCDSRIVVADGKVTVHS